MKSLKTLRNATQLLLASAIVVLTIPVSYAEQKVVNVYNWSDYIDEAILADFEKETGIKVKYDVFDTNELLETKLLTGGTGYDVVVPSGSFLRRQISVGVFKPLDKSKLPNLKNMWPQVSERISKTYDPDNKYSINYMWGTSGIGYNKAKVNERLKGVKLDSLAVLFDKNNAKKLADCGIHVLDSPTELIPSALTYLKLNPNSDKPEDLQKAEELLIQIRPYIRKFHSSEYINGLSNGDICVAFGFSGDILQAHNRAIEAKNGVDIVYNIPSEGAQMWFDQMAIPKDAPHPQEALAFMNYMMDPKVIAKASNYVFYANGNLASQKYINKEVLDNPSIYPKKDVLAKLFVYTVDNPKYTRLLNRSWTKIKSGK